MELGTQTATLVLAKITKQAQAVSFIKERSVVVYAASWVRDAAGECLQTSTYARISDCLQRGLFGPM